MYVFDHPTLRLSTMFAICTLIMIVGVELRAYADSQVQTKSNLIRDTIHDFLQELPVCTHSRLILQQISPTHAIISNGLAVRYVPITLIYKKQQVIECDVDYARYKYFIQYHLSGDEKGKMYIEANTFIYTQSTYQQDVASLMK